MKIKALSAHMDSIDSSFLLPKPNRIHLRYFGQGRKNTEASKQFENNHDNHIVHQYDDHLDSSFDAIESFGKSKAITQASRCIDCGKCQDACPLSMNVPAFIQSIRGDDIEGAVRWIYKTNPLPNVCSRICSRPCETACAIELGREPVAIRRLKKYAMDGVDHERINEIAADNRAQFVTGKRVAIIGSGLAGLTVAHELIKKGHCVVIYETRKKPGGVLRDSKQDSRLPLDYLDEDIDTILSLGVDLRLNMRVGEDITMEKLHANYDAVLLASGMDDSGGRKENIKYLGKELTESLEWENGRILVDDEGRTTETWLWAAGDRVEHADAIHAIAGGLRAAESIHQSLMGNIR